MARVLVLGAGVSGHTAALYLKKRLGKAHEVVVVSPNSQYNWIPSNIWVGVGKMTTDDAVFPLAPIYKKKGIEFVQAKAFALWPEGDADDDRAAVEIEHTSPEKAGRTEKLRYDYVINATCPKLNFGATPGPGPDAGHTVSVCTPSRATEANTKLTEVIEACKSGKTQRVVVGVGHGTCTCEGAVRPERLPHHQQVVDRVLVSRTRCQGDLRRCGDQHGQGGHPLRPARRLAQRPRVRLRDVASTVQGSYGAHSQCVDVGDGRRVCRVGWDRLQERHRRGHDHEPRGAGLGEVPRDEPRTQRRVRCERYFGGAASKWLQARK